MSVLLSLPLSAPLSVYSTQNVHQPVLNASLILNEDLWALIATSIWASNATAEWRDPSAYWVLVQVAKSMALPAAKTMFIRTVIDCAGPQTVLPNGDLHSVNDQPALTIKGMQKQWYKDNILHRGHGLPAIIYADGTQVWYDYGRRRDLPFMIGAHGEQYFAGDDESLIYGGGADMVMALVRIGDTTVCNAYGEKTLWKNGQYVRKPFVELSTGLSWNRAGDLPTNIWRDGSQRWLSPIIHNSRRTTLTAAAVMDIYAGWISEWHQRGEFLELSLGTLGGMTVDMSLACT